MGENQFIFTPEFSLISSVHFLPFLPPLLETFTLLKEYQKQDYSDILVDSLETAEDDYITYETLCLILWTHV